MAKAKIQDRVVTALLSQGYREVYDRAFKYRVFAKEGSKSFIYSGKAGAFRVGPNLKASLPCDKMRDRLLLGMAI